MKPWQTRFTDRHDAGRQLAVALQEFRDARPLILALPRGGVPVAFEVAKALQAELDLLLVRKIGAPGEPELGLGAVVDGRHPQLVLNPEIVADSGASPAYIEAEEKRQLAELERRRRLYLKGEAAANPKGRTVIVVDDGIATGATVIAALRGVRRNAPLRLVLAIPLAPRDRLAAIRAECDDLVCLATPEPFLAVGEHYEDFEQTSDGDVTRLLTEARQFPRSRIRS